MDHVTGVKSRGLDGFKGKACLVGRRNGGPRVRNVSDPMLHGDERFAVMFDVAARSRTRYELARSLAHWHGNMDRE